MYTVIVQNSETDDLDQFGPYESLEVAKVEAARYRRIMDDPYDFTDVFRVWVQPIRTFEQSRSAHKSLIDLYLRLDPESRTLDNPMGLD